MNIQNKTVLITGANRGIGRALVQEALRRGAKRVYAGMRGASDIADPRVTPLTLDVTDASQIEEAVAKVDTLDVLINNAGIALFDELNDPRVITQHLAVNLFGPLNVINAFLPLLRRSKGAIVNNVSTMALAPFPVTPAYAISKAAAFNMTQSFRALSAAQGVNVQPLVIVQGAFSSGGAQVNEWREEPRTDMQDTLTLSKNKSEWKFGVTANLHPFRTYNADNFGGTYTFASLAGYEAGQPEQFTVTTGNPLLSFQQDDYAWFAQYERKIGSASLFAGVRNEFQSGLSHYLNLAPRLAAAFAPGKDHRTVLRIGGGVFYDRRPPPVLEQTLRYDGLQTQQFVVTDPSYPALPPAMPGSLAAMTVWRIDPNMTLPRVYQASATVERQLPFGFMLVSDYSYQRGTHLLRALDINAPLPSTGLRPNPDEGNIDQIESSASSRGNILTSTLKSPPMRRFQFFAQYTLSRLYDDTGAAFPPPPGTAISAAGLFAALLPANSYDLRSEWGRANNDARNRFGLSGTVQLPWKLIFGTMTTIRSGLPFDITTGQVNPEGVANVRPPGVARNTGEGPGQASVDVHLGRKIPLHFGERKVDAEVGIDSFNVLNHTNLDNYIGITTSPLFGKANAAADGRQMQFTLQAHF